MLGHGLNICLKGIIVNKKILNIMPLRHILFLWPGIPLGRIRELSMSQAEALQTDAPIQSSLVIEEHRLRFLPKHFGPSYLRGENLLYAWARRLSPEYSGGHWLFFELDNGGFYAAPANEGELYVCFNENSYEGHMGAEALGSSSRCTCCADCRTTTALGDSRMPIMRCAASPCSIPNSAKSSAQSTKGTAPCNSNVSRSS